MRRRGRARARGVRLAVLRPPKLGSTASRFPRAPEPTHKPVNDDIIRVHPDPCLLAGLQVDAFGELPVAGRFDRAGGLAGCGAVSRDGAGTWLAGQGGGRL
jgi:hypothetical protein